MGKTGPVYYLVAGRWFSAPGLHRTVDVRDAVAAGGLQEDPARARSLARARVGARAPIRPPKRCCWRRSRRPRASTRRKSKAPDVAFQGDPAVRADRETTVERAVNTDKDVFKVGDVYYMCYQGVWFVGKSRDRSVGSRRARCPQEIYQIPASSPAHHVTYVTVEEDDDDDWVVFAAAAGYTGMMVAWGCTVWGIGLVLSALLGYGGFYPVLLRALPDLRLLRLVQPVDRRLRTQRRRSTVRTAAPASARATTRAPAPTRAARRRTVRTARAASRRRTTRAPAPTRRRGRARTSTAAGARPRCSAATTGRRPIATPTGRPATRRARSGPTKAAAVTRRGAGGGARRRRRRRQRLRRQRRQRLSPRRTAPGRSTKTAAGRTPTGSRPGRPTPQDRSTTRQREPAAGDHRPHAQRSRHGRSAQSRLRRAPRGHAAHQRLRQLQRRQRHAQHRQLSRRRAPRRRCAAAAVARRRRRRR